MSGAILYADPNNNWVVFAGNVAGGVVTPIVNGLYTTLVSPGVLDPMLTFARAQSGSFSMSVAADNTTWSTYAADIPRFYGATQGLLMEGARTNLVRNPRGEGEVVGSPGTLPTNGLTSGLPGGVSRTVLASRSINGAPGSEMQLAGTAAGTANPLFLWEWPAVDTVVAPSTTYTTSCFGTLTGGGFTNVSNFRLRVQTYLADGTTSVSDHLSSTMFPTGVQSRMVFTFTTAATAVRARAGVVQATAVGAIDFTCHYGAAQLELGPSVSTPVLPDVASPAASTRGADMVTAALATLGIDAGGVCTLLMSFIPTTIAADQVLLQIDDGSDDNRYRVAITVTTGAITVAGIVGGVSAVSATAGSAVAGTPCKLGVSVFADGSAALSVDGAASVTLAPADGPTSGLLTFRLGNRFSGGVPMFGVVNVLRLIRPTPISAAALPAVVSALP